MGIQQRERVSSLAPSPRPSRGGVQNVTVALVLSVWRRASPYQTQPAARRGRLRRASAYTQPPPNSSAASIVNVKILEIKMSTVIAEADSRSAPLRRGYASLQYWQRLENWTKQGPGKKPQSISTYAASAHTFRNRRTDIGPLQWPRRQATPERRGSKAQRSTEFITWARSSTRE